MNKIENTIKLLEEIIPTKDEFINDELRPSAKTSFNCCNCSANNEIEIIPYQTGFPFSQIYKNNFLSIKSILNNRIASPSSNWVSHFGEYLVYDLPTLYFVKKCSNCNEKFFVVFGFGESQPSKWVCKISSIWQIEEIALKTST